MKDITLTPMVEHHRAALLAVRVHYDQVAFSGQPADVIGTDLPQIDTHVVLSGQCPIGMFRIDCDYHKHHLFADPASVGLRTFLIDKNHQRQGIAKAVSGRLLNYLSEHYPTKTSVILTVNLRNSIAKAIYLHGGFIDTQAQYMGGLVGPQNILKLHLN